ncbi:MAG: transglutaminase family protein [Sphingobacteriia bacterium]|nr:transglutaminase family protein [Sphingobacteriia bacterium]
MQQTKELTALFTLIDDPDEEVYTTVSDKITEFGKGIIPNLENLWENTLSEEVQSRIEMLIHRLHYKDLVTDLTEWEKSPYHDLLFGALLVAKFQYPDLHTTPVLQEIEKIRRNIWLELNSFLTPLEQANVLSSIVYNYYNLKGIEVNYDNPDDFFIHKVLESKKGNAISNGIIYQVMCELLDINARIVNIPKQMILAFYHSDYDHSSFIGHPQEKIHFFVDALNGHAYSHQDIENYFKRMAIQPNAGFFKPVSHKRTIQLLIEEIAKCFTRPSQEYKQKELIELANLLDD